jgi:hypothetical protein
MVKMKRSWLKVSNKINQEKVETFLQYAIPFLKQLGYLSKTRKFPYKELIEKFEQAEPYITFIIDKENLRKLTKALEDHYFWSDIIDKFWDFVRTIDNYDTAMDYALKVNPQDLINRIEQSFKIESSMKEKWLKIADLESKLPYITQMGIDEARVKKLNKLDPTDNIAEYTKWLAKIDRDLRKQNKPGLLENDELRHKLEQALALHNRLKKSKDLPEEGKDIERFKTVDQFLEFMQPIINKIKSKELKPLTDPSKLPTGAEIIYDKSPYTIIKITDAKVMQDTCSLLNITDVCVSGSEKYGYSLKYAEDYLGIGPLYIVLKNNHPYAVVSHDGEIRDPFDKLLFPEQELLDIFKEIGIGYEQFMEFVKENVSVSIPSDMMSDSDRAHFAEYFAKEYNTLSDKGKLFVLTYNSQFRKGRKDEIREVTKRLLDQGLVTDVFIAANKFGLEDVKKHAWQKIISDPKASYDIARMSNFKDVPNELIQSISKSSEYSYYFAEKCLESKKEIPNEIIQGISEDPYYYSLFLLKTGKDIPNELMQEILKNPEYSYRFAINLLESKKDIPNELIQSISKDSWYSYEFAENLLESKKDIPNEIIQGISKNSEYSYNFAIKLLESKKEIPDEIIQRISKNSEYSYKFAEKCLESGKEVPNEIIQGISKDSWWSYEFSKDLNFDKSRIPLEIQETVKKYEGYEEKFEKQGSLSVKSKWLKQSGPINLEI